MDDYKEKIEAEADFLMMQSVTERVRQIKILSEIKTEDMDADTNMGRIELIRVITNQVRAIYSDQ